MHLPLWLVIPLLPTMLWPITVPLVLGLTWLAVRSRGRIRWFAIAVIAILVGPTLLFFGLFIAKGESPREAQLRAERAGLESVLEREMTLDGITLPAGTRMGWTNASHTRWDSASFRRPLDFHGLPLRSMTRVAAGWYVSLAGPRRIEDWDCAEENVIVTGDGELVACRLSRDVTWKGWDLPRLAIVTLNRTERTIVVDLPYVGRVEGREPGPSLPSPATLNDDGSPSSASYARDDPSRVAPVPLWGGVSWIYDPATLGQGRNRAPLALQGMTDAPVSPEAGGTGRGWERVVVTVATGVISRHSPGSR